MDNDGKLDVSKTMLSCNEVELLLDDYLDNDTTPAQRVKLDAHLSSCEHCRSLIKDCELIIVLAKSLAERPVPEGVSRRLRQKLEEETGCHFPCNDIRILTKNHD